jgi:hypothetical protein
MTVFGSTSEARGTSCQCERTTFEMRLQGRKAKRKGGITMRERHPVLLVKGMRVRAESAKIHRARTGCSCESEMARDGVN